MLPPALLAPVNINGPPPRIDSLALAQVEEFAAVQLGCPESVTSSGTTSVVVPVRIYYFMRVTIYVNNSYIGQLLSFTRLYQRGSVVQVPIGSASCGPFLLTADGSTTTSDPTYGSGLAYGGKSAAANNGTTPCFNTYGFTTIPFGGTVTFTE